MNKFWSFSAVFAVIFFGMLLAGVHISRGKPMWDDELFSLECSIEARTYAQILKAPFWSTSTEGNSSPVFYLFQKAWNSTLGLEAPRCPPKLLPIQNQSAATWMRLPHILALSLAVAMGVVWIGVRAGWGGALLLFGFSLGTSQYWLFLAEMRPYAVWVLLSTAQTIFLFEALEKGITRRLFWALMATHVGLAFTVSLSIVQIFAALLVAALLFPRDRWRGIGACIPALLVCVTYALWREDYRYWIPPAPLNLLFANLAKSKAVLLVALLGLTGHQLWRTSTRADGEVLVRNVLFLVLLVGGMTSVLAWFWIENRHNSTEGSFELPSRYFLALAPVANITLARLVAMKSSQRGLLALTIVVVLYQCGRTFLDVRGIF